MWVERRFRRAFPMTHEEYLAEPDRNVEWFLQFDGLD